jgi:mannose/fructose/N-acetylgalactosamine-specific phosphotransferase system component IIC
MELIGSLGLLLLLAAWAAADTAAFGQFMVGQPIASGWLAGVIVGRPLEGLFMGAALQMLWSRLAPVGAAAYPDVGPATVGGVGTLLFWPAAPAGTVGAAPDAAGLAARFGFDPLPDGWRVADDPLAMMTGLGLALGAGALGQRLVVAMRRHNADLGLRADAAASRGDFGGVEAANRLGLLRAAGLGVVVAGGALVAGAGAAAVGRLATGAAGPSTAANPGPLLFWWIALAALGTALWSEARRDWLWLAAGAAGGALFLVAR